MTPDPKRISVWSQSVLPSSLITTGIKTALQTPWAGEGICNFPKLSAQRFRPLHSAAGGGERKDLKPSRVKSPSNARANDSLYGMKGDDGAAVLMLIFPLASSHHSSPVPFQLLFQPPTDLQKLHSSRNERFYLSLLSTDEIVLLALANCD